MNKIKDRFFESLMSEIPGGSLAYFAWEYRENIAQCLNKILPTEKNRIRNWVALELRNLLSQSTCPSLAAMHYSQALETICKAYPKFSEDRLADELLSQAWPSKHWIHLGGGSALESVINCTDRISVSVSAIQFLDIFCLLKINQQIFEKMQLIIDSYMGADQADHLSNPLPEVLIYPVSTFSKRVADNRWLQCYQLVSVPHRIKSSIVYREKKQAGTLNIHGLGKGVSLDLICAAPVSLERKIEVATWDSECFLDYIGLINNLDECELYSAFDPFLTLLNSPDWIIDENCSLSSPMGVFIRRDLSPGQRKAAIAITQLLHGAIMTLHTEVARNSALLGSCANHLLGYGPFFWRTLELYRLSTRGSKYCSIICPR